MNPAPQNRHYCIFRTDRIGDLVLTLPMAGAIKRHDAQARVTFCVQERTADIARMCPLIDGTIAIPDRDIDTTPAGFVRELRAHAFDVALFAYPRPRIAAAAARAGIPLRAGTGFRAYSLFFNARVYDHRRSGMLHERDYNLRLLDRIGIPGFPAPESVLHVPADSARQAGDFLSLAGEGVWRNDFIVIHPGSGGSAKDWSVRNFGLFGQQFLRKFPIFKILISGTKLEHGMMLELKDLIGDGAAVLPRPAPLPVLCGVMERSALVIANSTGPLHLAAALGVPVLGLYSVRREYHPRRWGPLGSATAVLTPPPDPACPDCRQEPCAAHDDMERIAVDDALTAASRLLAGTHTTPRT